jgi:hypothetical protein
LLSEKSFGTYHAANRRANNFATPQTFNTFVCRQASAELQAVFEEELSRCSLAAQQELGGNLQVEAVFEEELSRCSLAAQQQLGGNL